MTTRVRKSAKLAGVKKGKGKSKTRSQSSRRRRPVKADAEMVARALSRFPAPPSNVEMLTNCTRIILKVPKSARHPHQVTMLNCVKEAFEVIEENLTRDEERFQRMVDNAQEIRVDLEESCRNASSDLEQFSEVMQNAIVVRDERKGISLATDNRVSETRKEVQITEKEAQMKEKARDAARAVLEDHFAVLESGDVKNSAASAKHMKPVTAALEGLELDASLVRALPMSIGLKPGERGSFDDIVINYAKTALVDGRARAESEVLVAHGRLQDAQAAHEDVMRASAEASADYARAEQDWKRAVAAHKEGIKMVKDAERTLAAHPHDMQQAAAQLKKASKELERFHEIMRVFTALQNREDTQPLAVADVEPVPDLVESVVEEPAVDVFAGFESQQQPGFGDFTEEMSD